MTLIGTRLDDAIAALEREGMSYDIIENRTEKCARYDAILVTNAVIRDGHARLTVSPFLLEIEDRS